MIPSHTTYAVASSRHQERLDTAARIREIKQARREGALHATPVTQRRLTVARLTAARLAGVLTALKTSFHF